ncbi:MAG: hypothetical protein ACQERZ_09085 [Fusobacteriota bacterium]
MTLIIILGFIIIIILIVHRIQLKNKLEKVESENCNLIEKNQELEGRKDNLDSELKKLNVDLEKVYKILNKSEILDNITNDYGKLRLKIEEEINKINRYDILYFSMVIFSIDFYNENQKIHGDILEKFEKKVRGKIVSQKREIDFFAKKENQPLFYLLLPMTDVNGAQILVDRLLEKIKDIKVEKNFTFSILINEIQEKQDVNKLLKSMENEIKKIEEDGGNVIRIKN